LLVPSFLSFRYTIKLPANKLQGASILETVQFILIARSWIHQSVHPFAKR